MSIQHQETNILDNVDSGIQGQTDSHGGRGDWRSISLPHCIISVRKANGYVKKFDPIATWRGSDIHGEYQMPKCVISVKKRTFATCSKEILYNPFKKYARGCNVEGDQKKIKEEYRSDPRQSTAAAIIQLTSKSAERTCCCAYCGKFTKYAVRFTKVSGKRRRWLESLYGTDESMISRLEQACLHHKGVLYLCRAHFSTSDFQLVSGRVRLNSQAIPVPNSNRPDDPVTDDVDGHSDDDATKESGIAEYQVPENNVNHPTFNTRLIVTEPSTHIQFMKPSTSNPWSFYSNGLDANSNYMGMSGYMNFPMSLSMAPMMSFSNELSGIQQLEKQMLAQKMSIPLQPSIDAFLRDVIQPIPGSFSACISDISQNTDAVLGNQVIGTNLLHTDNNGRQ